MGKQEKICHKNFCQKFCILKIFSHHLFSQGLPTGFQGINNGNIIENIFDFLKSILELFTNQWKTTMKYV